MQTFCARHHSYAFGPANRLFFFFFLFEDVESESQRHPQDAPANSSAGPDYDSDAKLAAGQPHAVRFASVNQEIEPDQTLQSQVPSSSERQEQAEPIGNEWDLNAKDELRSLAISLEKSQLQESRLRHFAFEPVSLPATRVRILHMVYLAAHSALEVSVGLDCLRRLDTSLTQVVMTVTDSIRRRSIPETQAAPLLPM